MNLIDHKQAFESVWQKTFWQTLRDVGIEEKHVQIVQACRIRGDREKWNGCRQCRQRVQMITVYDDYDDASLSSFKVITYTLYILHIIYVYI